MPERLLGKYFCYSRVPGHPRTYVQDRLRTESATVAALMKDPRTHVYICGLKGMESGVDEAFADLVTMPSKQLPPGFAERPDDVPDLAVGAEACIRHAVQEPPAAVVVRRP